MFLVNKKDGGFRVVQDFRALNNNSHLDKYSMKDVTECIGEIGRSHSTIFSTLDLTSGFWQMTLHPQSRAYTAFTVPGLGEFEWVTSAMGLLGCPATFQRLVEAIVDKIRNVIVYIDDLIVHSKDHLEHLQILEALFSRLSAHGMKVRLEKCKFGSNDVMYLGFHLTKDGIKPGVDKLKAVRDAKPPANVHEVRQFLGLCNFFRSHVRNFATIASPLTKLTRKESLWRKGGKLPREAYLAFRELQAILVSEPVVDYPRRDRPYALFTDASFGDDRHEGGLGAILTQIDENKQHCVIGYASRKLAVHEKNYTPFLLEMQAAIFGMEHFGNHLKGRHFTLFTDHKPLEKLGKVHTKTLNRLQEIMNVYDFEIVYIKGKEIPADFLSRNAVGAINLDNTALAQE
jgi:putative transposase